MMGLLIQLQQWLGHLRDARSNGTTPIPPWTPTNRLMWQPVEPDMRPPLPRARVATADRICVPRISSDEAHAGITPGNKSELYVGGFTTATAGDGIDNGPRYTSNFSVWSCLPNPESGSQAVASLRGRCTHPN